MISSHDLVHALVLDRGACPQRALVRALSVGEGTLEDMEFWVLHGSDDEAIRQRRRALLDAAGEAHEVVDLAEEPLDALLNALSSPSLFAPRRVVALEGLGGLDDRSAKRLAETAKTSDAYVVARADTVPAAVLKVLKQFATEEKFTTPRNAAAKDRVREIARRHSVKLSAPVERLLVARVGHDLDRVASVCHQLELAGISTPSERQISVLVGSSAPGGVPWAITDALEQGRFDQALEAALGQEPMAVLGYLSNQVTTAARIAELDAAANDPRSIAGTLGVTPFVAEKAAWWRRALGERIHDALTALARADALAKSSAGAENALAFALARLSVLLTQVR
jgi:DNA polymerase III delta subunit